MLKSNKVYKSKVRKDGQALFMLPLHRRYMIETNYKKAIDVIDYMDCKVQSIVRSEDMFTFDLNYKVKFPERYLPQNKNDYTEFSSEIPSTTNFSSTIASASCGFLDSTS